MLVQNKQFLPWLRSTLERLCVQHEQGRLAHAYLLQGSEGLGKFGFALTFAQFLLCENPQQQRGCGQCQSCHLFEVEHHPDLNILRPPEGKKVITVDQVRAAIEFMNKTANQGRAKVVICEPAEAMNSNAGNALLKVLEEPPSGTHILMISHQPGLLLPTMRSRCQPIDFSSPERADALTWLTEEGVVSHAETLLKLAGGSPLKAKAYADEDWQHMRSQLHTVLRDLLCGNVGVVSAAAELAQSSLELCLESMLLCIHDLTRCEQAEVDLLDSELSELKRSLPEHFDLPLHQFYQELIQLRSTLSKGIALNSRLALENILLTWSDLGHNTMIERR